MAYACVRELERAWDIGINVNIHVEMHVLLLNVFVND